MLENSALGKRISCEDVLNHLFDVVLLFTEEGNVLATSPNTYSVANLRQDPLYRDLWPRIDTGEADFEVRGNTKRFRVLKLEEEFLLAIDDSPNSGQSIEFDHTLSQGFWRLDSNGVIQNVNTYLAEMLESSVSRLIGQPSERFMVWRDSSAVNRFEAAFLTARGNHRQALVAGSDTASGRVEVITDITNEFKKRNELEKRVEQMSALARKDPLTGLSNRIDFDERLSEQVESHVPFAVLLIDLDDLKQTNDQYGHAAGDQSLRKAANSLQQAMRGSDLVCRLGGDEFAIITQALSRHTAEDIAERVRQALEAVDIRASVGWAHSYDGQSDVAQRADQAMYDIKKRRKQN